MSSLTLVPLPPFSPLFFLSCYLPNKNRFGEPDHLQGDSQIHLALITGSLFVFAVLIYLLFCNAGDGAQSPMHTGLYYLPPLQALVFVLDKLFIWKAVSSLCSTLNLSAF